MQLHAAVCIDGRDRVRLERMCRYFLRPPFARESITALPNGDVRIRFKHPTARGSTHADLSRDVFIARLAALVPSSGFNMVRYYGTLANGHRLNRSIRPHTETNAPKQLSLFDLRHGDAVPLRPGKPGHDVILEPAPKRLSWAKLLARVFQLDITVCGKCGGPMRVLEAVNEPAKIANLLHGARPPPRPAPLGQTWLFER